MKLIKQVKWSHFSMGSISVFTTVISGFILIGYLRQLGFNEIYIGIFGGMIGYANLFSLFGSWLVEGVKNTKKLYFTVGTIFVVSFYFGVILGYFAIPLNKNNIIIIFFLLFLSYISFSIIIQTVLPWLHSLTGSKKWGRFYSTRMVVGEFICLIASYGFGRYLGKNPLLINFIIIFSLASFFGLLGVIFMLKVPLIEEQNIKRFNIIFYLELIKKALKIKEFKLFLIIQFIRSFGFFMMAPFLPLFLLEELELSYFQIAIMINISLIFAIIGYKLWGYIQGRFSDYIALTWCGTISSFIPILLALSTQKYYFLLYIVFILGDPGALSGGMLGIMNSGYFISGVSMAFKYSDGKNKSVYNSLNFFTVGLASVISPILGGFFINYLNSVNLNINLWHVKFTSLRILFLTSNVFLIISLILLFLLKKLTKR